MDLGGFTKVALINQDLAESSMPKSFSLDAILLRNLKQRKISKQYWLKNLLSLGEVFAVFCFLTQQVYLSTSKAKQLKRNLIDFTNFEPKMSYWILKIAD